MQYTSNKLPLKGLLALGLLISGCASQAPIKVLEVEPTLVPIKQSHTVRIQLDHLPANTQVAVLPGGPYLQAEGELKNPGSDIVSVEGTVWVNHGATVQAYQQKDGQMVTFSNFFTQREIGAMDHHAANIYIADDFPALTTVNVEDPTSPQKSGELILDEQVDDIAVSETLLCALTRSHQLLAIPLEKSIPTQVASRQNAPKGVTGLAATDNGCITVHPEQGIAFHAFIQGKLKPADTYHSNRVSFALSGDLFPIAVADGETGLTLLDTHEKQLQWAGSYNKLGNITAVSKQLDRVLVADDHGIVSLFDISRPDTPLLLSDFRLNTHVDAMTYDNGIATVLSGTRLQQIDFSAEGTPAITNLGVNLGGSRRSFVKDDVLYVADWFSGMHLYDINKPNSPRLISSFHTPGSSKGVLVRDNVAFVADDDHGLQIVDVSNLRHPTLISSLPLTGLAYTMKLVDNTLYLASHYGGLHIIDVSDIKKPKLLGAFDTPGKSWAVEIVGNLAYIADDTTGVVILDISNPRKPEVAGQYYTGGFAEDIVIRDGIAYVAFFDQGLHILSLKSPKKPKLITQLDTPGNARGIQLRGDRLYLASWEAGINIIDIGDIKKPRIVGHYDTAGAAWGLSVEDQHLYVMDWWGGVRVLDIADEKRPTEIAQYQGSGVIHNFAVQENFGFAASGSRGLQVFDITNVLNPVWATGVDLEGCANDVALAGDYAFVAAGDGGLVVVDIVNAFQSRWAARLLLNSAADRVFAMGDNVIVATENGPLHIIDVRNPKKPHALRTIDITGFVDGWVENDQLFFTNRLGETYFIIAKKLTSNSLPQKLPLEKARLVRAWDDQLYLWQPKKGIYLYQQINGQYIFKSLLQLPHELLDLQKQNDSLFATAKDLGLIKIDTSNPEQLKLETLYETTHHIERITQGKNAMFFAGEPIITSAKLLPDIPREIENNSVLLRVPNNLPFGAYHVMLQSPEGKQTLIHNAFKVSFPKKVKPKFSLEDLKKILQQKDFEGKAPK